MPLRLMPSSETATVEALTSLLRRVPLFDEMPIEALALLVPHCRRDRFARPANLFLQGDPADRVWIVRQGEVKIVRHDEGSREVILEVISQGQAFGGAVIFLPEHPATARPLTETVETISFPSEIYAEAMLNSPATALRIIRMLGLRLHSTLRMGQLAGERVERRLAYILLKMGRICGRPDPEGTLLTIPLSRQDLADMSGTTIETTIRIMSRFRKDGLVRTRRGGYLVLLDIDHLKRIARADSLPTARP